MVVFLAANGFDNRRRRNRVHWLWEDENDPVHRSHGDFQPCWDVRVYVTVNRPCRKITVALSSYGLTLDRNFTRYASEGHSDETVFYQFDGFESCLRVELWFRILSKSGVHDY